MSDEGKQHLRGTIFCQSVLNITKGIKFYLFSSDAVPEYALQGVVALAVVLPNPPFCYLLLSVHQKMLVNTKSRARLSKRLVSLQSIERLIFQSAKMDDDHPNRFISAQCVRNRNLLRT